MNAILAFIQREPAVCIGVVDAALVLAVTFGVPITTEQKGAVDAILAAVAAVLIRSQVTPTAKLATFAAAAVVPPAAPKA